MTPRLGDPAVCLFGIQAEGLDTQPRIGQQMFQNGTRKAGGPVMLSNRPAKHLDNQGFQSTFTLWNQLIQPVWAPIGHTEPLRSRD